MLDRELSGFEQLFDVGEEPLGIRAIDQTMIVREREEGHVPNRDLIVAIRAGDHLRALLNRTDAENGDLRLIDDRRPEEAAEDAGGW